MRLLHTILVRKRRVAPVEACDKLGSALRGIFEVFAAHRKRGAKRRELPRRGTATKFSVSRMVFVEEEVLASFCVLAGRHAAFFTCLRRRCAA